MIDDDFGNWLAGFIDGEGSFLIMPMDNGWCCRMFLLVRRDDEPILQEIIDRTGIGYLYRHPSKKPGFPGSKPQTTWQVTSRGDVFALVDLLDRYPLRAKKARDYALWREAVLTWKQVLPRHRHGQNGPLWERIAALKKELADVRAYG